MPLCPAQVTSRANTQLLRVKRIAGDTTLSSAARMELLSVQADEWRANVSGTTGQLAAQREARRQAPRLFVSAP
jgi:hypothetical protein